MTDRITAARLAEIERIHKGGIALMDSKIARWSAARGDIHNLADSALDAVTDLLAELREVTRERDEALASAKSLQAAWHDANIEIGKVEQERDRLAAEVASHERYRELVRSGIAEQEWKKDNDALREERDKLKQEINHAVYMADKIRAERDRAEAEIGRLRDALAAGMAGMRKEREYERVRNEERD